MIRVGEGLERILDDGELPREGRPLVRVPVSGQSAVAPPDGRGVARAAREEERVRDETKNRRGTGPSHRTNALRVNGSSIAP